MKVEDILKSERRAEITFWLHSVLAALSMSFFLSLFSAGENTNTNIFLQISILFYTISLITNSSAAFIIRMTDYDGELAYHIQLSKNSRWIFICSQWFFLLGTFFLILFYNTYFAFLFLFLFILACQSILKAMKELRLIEKKRHEKRMQELELENVQLELHMEKIRQEKQNEEQKEVLPLKNKTNLPKNFLDFLNKLILIVKK